MEMIGRPEYEGQGVDDIERNFGGVDIICTARNPRTREKLILVEKIFRVPVGRYVLSFPAGSKDIGDVDPGETALRELREETGYIGKVLSVTMTH